MGKNLKNKELEEGITQLPSGNYQVKIRIGNRNRLARTFEDYTEAQKWKYEILQKRVSNHGIVYYSNMTLDQWFDEWIEGKKIRTNTKQSYIGRYCNRISPIIGRMRVKDITLKHCKKVIEFAEDKNDSSGSVAKIKSIMHKLFEDAIQNKMIESNPVTKEVEYDKEDAPERTILTASQQNEFLRIGEEYAHFDEFVFVLETGVRIGELCGLRWEDINWDWNKKAIYIKRTMSYDREKKHFIVNPPKTKSSIRTIPLTARAYEILERRYKERAERPQVEAYKEYVFLGREGRPLRNYSYNKCLARIAKRIGVENFTMHCLRHTFATRCIEKGVIPKVLQKWLGHKKSSTTMDLYVHVTDDALFSEMEKMDVYTKNDSELVLTT